MTAKEIAKRLEEKKAERLFIETEWKEAFDNTFPLRGQRIGNNSLTGSEVHGAAHAQNARIYDSTLKVSARQLAAALLSGLTPANSRWFGLEVGDLKDQDATDWLDTAADAIWRNIHNCNYDSTALDCFVDYSCAGMFPMYIGEGNFAEGKLYNFQEWPLASCYPGDSTGKGIIDTVYRLDSMTAEQLVAEYGADNVSAEVSKAAEVKPDTKFEFVQAIFPRGKSKKITELPIASIHMEVKTRKILRKSGYHEMPVVFPRWMPVPGSVYSEGPVADALPDHKTLNDVVRLVLANADMAIAGMWGAIDDGVLNPKVITIGARKIIMMANKDSMFPLASSAKFNVAAIEIDRLQGAIKRVLMTDQLHPETGPAMTATEIQMRKELLMMLLGPHYGRLQAEYLTPFVTRCFGIAYRAGALLPPPQALQGQLTRVTYKSPLARSQQIEDVAAMDRMEASLGMLAKDGITAPLDNYDFDKAVGERGERLGVPAGLIRDEKAVKKLREDRAAAQKQEMDAQQQAEMQKTLAPTMAKGMMNNAA